MDVRNKISILHLYYDLMNLYGDWANVELMVRALQMRGQEVILHRKSLGDEISFAEYDIIYIGSGTERSLLACLPDINARKESLLKCIEDEVFVLATGNSHEIFGKAVTDASGNRHEALGLLDFETVQGDARITGDCVCEADFIQEKLIGFINRASIGQSGNVARPFVFLLSQGADDKSDKEGIRYKNLLGTYMTGPILVRNPPLIKYFTDKVMERSSTIQNVSVHQEPNIKHADFARGDKQEVENAYITEDSGSDLFFAHQEKAYQKALAELSARIDRRS